MSENGKKLEEFLEVVIAKDLMQAFLKVKPNTTELQTTETELLAFLKQNGVEYGINNEALQSFLRSPESFVNNECMVAVGRDPIDGEDAYVEMIYRQKNSTQPKESEDGKVDFYSITEISNVERGQLIAKKMPAVEGVSGHTVTNQEVKAKGGKDFRMKAGKNVVIDQESQAIYATAAGQVSITERDKINVFPVFEVNGDLDFSVGNIDFVGNVVIRGNIPTGFKVKAKGDIRITGGVEGAELESEGSIEISSGITAQHKGFIKAGKNVKTTFIINGNVAAEGNILVSQSIMHSTITAGENIECLGPKGLIVGGIFQAGKSFKCRTLGNLMSTPTTVEVGTNPAVTNRLKEINGLLKEYFDTLHKTEQALGVLNQMMVKLGQLSPDKKELQIKLTNTKLEIEKKISQLRGEAKEIEEVMKGPAQSVIEVSGIMYPGTKLVFGKFITYIKDNQQRMKFYLDHNEIVNRPLM